MISRKWDLRFLELARTVSLWSKDPTTRVGAVLVRPNKTVASVGFNGFARTMQDIKEHYDNREEKLSRVIHAEMNSLLNLSREEPVTYHCYVTLVPCDRCIVHLAQAGITRFIAPTPSPEHTLRWGASFARSRAYASEMGLELVEYDIKEIKDLDKTFVST